MVILTSSSDSGFENEASYVEEIVTCKKGKIQGDFE